MSLVGTSLLLLSQADNGSGVAPFLTGSGLTVVGLLGAIILAALREDWYPGKMIRRQSAERDAEIRRQWTEREAEQARQLKAAEERRVADCLALQVQLDAEKKETGEWKSMALRSLEVSERYVQGDGEARSLHDQRS